MKVVGFGQYSPGYMAYVDGYPDEDAKKEASGMVIYGGGPMATALAVISRPGAKTRFMGIVSDDGAWLEIIRGLKREGVGVSGLKLAQRASALRISIGKSEP